jgi:hypothetical protein
MLDLQPELKNAAGKEKIVIYLTSPSAVIIINLKATDFQTSD